MFRNLLTTAAAMFFAGSAALAGSGGLSADDVADFDILPGWRTETGTYMTALRIRLAPGWKTYWRAPGDGGIPPRFDWDGSRNLGAVRFHWPAPEVFHQNGMRTIAYQGELVLPIELTPRQPGRDVALRAEIELGVCQDICMPVQVRVSADLDGAGSRDARIRGALNARPDTAREAGMAGIDCSVEPISDGLRLTARIELPRIGPEEVAVFELPDQTIWVSEAATRRDGGHLVASADMVPPGNKPFALDRGDVRITVLGAGRAVDIQGCRG